MPLPPRSEAIERFLAVARALKFAREEPKGSNAGQAVEAFQEATGNKPPDPWCASFVSYVGRAAFGTSWPMPVTASCQIIATWGSAHIVESGELGDLFLLWYPSLNRFAHVGIILQALDGPKTYTTLEANTNPGDGSREGWGVFERRRTLGPQDRIVRWCP